MSKRLPRLLRVILFDPFWSFFACFRSARNSWRCWQTESPLGWPRQKVTQGGLRTNQLCFDMFLTTWLEWWEGVSDSLCAFNLRVAIVPRSSVTSARFAGWCQAFSMFSPFRPSKTLISSSSSSSWLFYTELKTLQSPGLSYRHNCKNSKGAYDIMILKVKGMKRSQHEAEGTLSCHATAMPLTRLFAWTTREDWHKTLYLGVHLSSFWVASRNGQVANQVLEVKPPIFVWFVFRWDKRGEGFCQGSLPILLLISIHDERLEK